MDKNLPIIKSQNKKLELIDTDTAKRGVIYLGHLPYGFFEKEVKSYFSQFGKVTNVRLSRNIKTGKSRGYGFVQFQDEEIARIAATAMNNYLMFNKIIKCEYLDEDKVHPNMFKNARKIFRPINISHKHVIKYNLDKSEGKQKKQQKRTMKRLQKKLILLKKFNIEYIPDLVGAKEEKK